MDATPSAPDVTAFANRLRKNLKVRTRWAAREGLTAYRLYDQDLPEFPFVVEWYAGRVHLVEYPRRKTLRAGRLEAERAAIVAAVAEVLPLDEAAIVTKTHLPHAWGRSQYGTTGAPAEPFTVEEHGMVLEVDLGARLDTGLYMDHRRTRARVRKEAGGKRMLNLFAYTGSFTVAAGLGGASATTTVDLSGPYLDWARRNLRLNGLNGPEHTLIQADVLAWLAQVAAEGAQRWDLIVLDPPPFSTSKQMRGDFRVQRDHPRLLNDALSILAPGGTLYFSTNFRGFELSPDKVPGAHFEELTPRSLPEDFHRRDSHRLWRITAGEAEAEGAAARPRGGAAEPGSTRGSTGRAGRRRRSTGSP